MNKLRSFRDLNVLIIRRIWHHRVPLLMDGFFHLELHHQLCLVIVSSLLAIAAEQHLALRQSS